MLQSIFNYLAVNTIHRAMIFKTFYFMGSKLNIIKVGKVRFDSFMNVGLDVINFVI